MKTGTVEEGGAKKGGTEEEMSAGTIVATLLPLVLLAAMWVFIVRYLARANRRAVDCMKQNDQMISLLKEIRDVLSQRSP
jgi:large-conductance mechanosensitive channel